LFDKTPGKKILFCSERNFQNATYPPKNLLFWGVGCNLRIKNIFFAFKFHYLELHYNQHNIERAHLRTGAMLAHVSGVSSATEFYSPGFKTQVKEIGIIYYIFFVFIFYHFLSFFYQLSLSLSF
jgi:hypothetical protein